MVFFFFFGGVAPEVQKVLKQDAEICPLCGSPASLVEFSNVLRVFFVPVWKWGGENPAVKCNACPFMMPLDRFDKLKAPPTPRRKMPGALPEGDETPALRCWSCSAPIDSASFKFCPRCGVPL